MSRTKHNPPRKGTQTMAKITDNRSASAEAMTLASVQATLSTKALEDWNRKRMASRSAQSFESTQVAVQNFLKFAWGEAILLKKVLKLLAVVRCGTGYFLRSGWRPCLIADVQR